MTKRIMRRRTKKPIVIGKAAVLTPDDSRKKKNELLIAKKNYEIAILQIENKYPEAKTDHKKIWFDVQ